MKVQEKYAHGWRSLLASTCKRTAPAAGREALVMMEKGHKMLGIWRTGAEEKIVLSLSNACCWREVQFQGLFFYVRRFKGVTMSEKFGMNFL